MANTDSGSFSYSSNPLGNFAGSIQQTALTAKQVEDWRQHINNCNHPIIVFGADCQPILLNQAIREYLSEPTPIEQPTAFLWQEVCETVGRFVAEASGLPANEISDAFPISGKCFVVIGSLLRTSSGRFLGAVVNVADVSNSAERLQAVLHGGSASASAPVATNEESTAQFQEWVGKREQARQKMSRLSRRENQVVCLVSEGLPNKSIARELDISVKTIEKHRANATRKLGVGSTPEMVRIAVTAESKVVGLPPGAPGAQINTFDA